MLGYKTFGVPNPELDIDTARERLVGQQLAIESVLTPLVGEMVYRTDDQEDVLAPVYKKLVQYGQYLNATNGERVDSASRVLLASARSSIGTVGGMLANTRAAIPPGTDITDPPSLPPDSNPPADASGLCPPGYHVVYGPRPGDYKCVRDDFGDAPEVPVPVPPPVSPPTPVPPPYTPPGSPPVSPPTVPVGCTVISSGTVTCLTDENYWILVDCTDPNAIKYQVVKCCGVPNTPVGWSVYGPHATPPSQDTIKSAASACVKGDIPPSPPAPSPPPPPAPPEDEPGECGEAPPEDEDGFKALPDPDAAPRPIDIPIPACDVILWSDANVCTCIEQYAVWWREFGMWAWNNIQWVASEACDLLDWEIATKYAAITQKILRIIGGKLTFNDPTMIDVANTAVGIAQRKYHRELARMLTVSWNELREYRGIGAGTTGQQLFFLYVAKEYVNFIGQYGAGYCSESQGGPTINLTFQHAVNVIDLCIKHTTPIEIPGLPDVEDLWRAGKISEPHAACLVRSHGYQWPITRAAWQTRTNTPTGADLVQWAYRDRPGEDELQRRLREIGYVDPRHVEVLRRNLAYLPPPSDAIRMARRDVFDPNKLGRAEMLAELREQVGLSQLFDAIGLEKTFVHTKDGRRLELPIDEMYWIADYEEASPTQAYEMLHRLRRNRVHLYKLPNADGTVSIPKPMDIDTVRKLLKEKDYNPIWRDRLAAISYRVLGRIDVRRMYALGVFGKPLGPEGWNAADVANPLPLGVAEKEVVERYLDMGSSEPDARIQGYYTSLDFALGKVRKTQTRKQASVIRAYRNGVIDPRDAVDRLTKITGSKELADDLVLLADADTDNARVEEVTRAVRSRYLNFQVDKQTARGMLIGVGIRPNNVIDLLATWDIRLAGRRKEIAAGSLCGYYAMGVISRQEFKERLMRAGYDDPESNRIIRKCELGELAKSAKIVAREEAAARRQREAREREAQRQESSRTRAVDREIAKRLATKTEKHLIGYYKEGLISVEEIKATLTLKAFSPTDVERWVETYIITDNNRGGGSNG